MKANHWGLRYSPQDIFIEESVCLQLQDSHSGTGRRHAERLASEELAPAQRELSPTVGA
jgi:hypothetical protein